MEGQHLLGMCSVQAGTMDLTELLWQVRLRTRIRYIVCLLTLSLVLLTLGMTTPGLVRFKTTGTDIYGNKEDCNTTLDISLFYFTSCGGYCRPERSTDPVECTSEFVAFGGLGDNDMGFFGGTVELQLECSAALIITGIVLFTMTTKNQKWTTTGLRIRAAFAVIAGTLVYVAVGKVSQMEPTDYFQETPPPGVDNYTNRHVIGIYFPWSLILLSIGASYNFLATFLFLHDDLICFYRKNIRMIMHNRQNSSVGTRDASF